MKKIIIDSLKLAFGILTLVATVFTVLGFSMKEVFPFECVSFWLGVLIRLLILVGIYTLITIAIIIIMVNKYKNKISVNVGANLIDIHIDNLFSQNSWRIIPMDTHFDTAIDDVVITKKSLHGQFVLNHGDVKSIKEAVEQEAQKRKMKANKEGKYTFPLGTAIPYEGKDGHYIMVAFNELNSNMESHTNMSDYVCTLIKIWHEIDRVYAQKNIALPVIGSGITRFDDGSYESEQLIRCMMWTLNICKIHFKSQVRIIVYNGESKRMRLYKFKNLFKSE